MSKRLLKISLVLILIVVGFHASGAEMAFCDDGGSSMMGQAHGCTVCQPTQHVFIAHQASIDFPNPTVTFITLQKFIHPINAPSPLFFRPPISL